MEQVSATLQTIASDVKIQIEWNPGLVSEYRLIGYQNRVLQREDFNNDKVDAGEIGAGHSVTAIYEITPVGSPAVLNDPLRYGGDEPANVAEETEELAFLRLRYKEPGEDESVLMELPIVEGMGAATVDIPAIALNGGPMLNGYWRGQLAGSGTIAWEARKRGDTSSAFRVQGDARTNR